VTAGPAFDAAAVSIAEPATWRVAGIIAALAFAAAACVHVVVLQRFPNSGDEYAYLWQATAFAERRMTAPSPEPVEAFQLNHIADVEGRRFGKYPPGWPLLLGTGVLLGVPGLVNPLLAALALAGIYRLGCTWVGARAAAAGAVVTGLTPFFLLNAGSYHSHPSCLFAITALALCLTWTAERPGRVPLLLAGASLGLAILVRPYTALLFAVPLLGAFAPAVWRRRRRVNPGWLVLGGVPLALFLAGVNAASTGSWWLLPWTRYDPVETIGFGAHGHTLVRGLKTTLRLCGEWVLYTSGVGTLLLLFAWRGRFPQRWLVWTLLLAPVAGYLFWWSHGGNRYGPRFYFEALLPFTLLAGTGVEYLARRPTLRPAAGVGLVVALALLASLSVGSYREIYARRDLERTVEKAGVSNAVVLLTTASADMVRIDLTRNPPDVERASVLYGLSRGARDREVQAAHPGRTLYLYRWTPDGGQLWRAGVD
jgi:hypothetical protein